MAVKGKVPLIFCLITVTFKPSITYWPYGVPLKTTDANKTASDTRRPNLSSHGQTNAHWAALKSKQTCILQIMHRISCTNLFMEDRPLSYGSAKANRATISIGLPKNTLAFKGKCYENKSFLFITNYHFVLLLISHSMHGIAWLDVIFVYVMTALCYNTTELCVQTVSHMQVKG